MQRKIGEHDWYQVKGFSGAGGSDPWIAASMINGEEMTCNSHRVVSFQQQYDFAAYATRNRLIADTLAPMDRQVMRALTIWEDDGGTLDVNSLRINGV